MSTPEPVTSDGYDTQFGTNVVGPFLFTMLLLPQLRAAAAPDAPARVVNLSSLGHMQAPTPCIVWDSLKPVSGTATEAKKHSLSPDVLYYQSKAVGIISQLAPRWGAHTRLRA